MKKQTLLALSAIAIGVSGVTLANTDNPFQTNATPIVSSSDQSLGQQGKCGPGKCGPGKCTAGKCAVSSNSDAQQPPANQSDDA